MMHDLAINETCVYDDAEVAEIKSLAHSLLKSVDCPICLEVLDDPVCTPCHHAFCRKCIQTVLQSKYKAPCPLCVAPINKRSLREKPKFREILQAVKEVTEAVKDDCGLDVSPPKRLLLETCSPEGRSSTMLAFRLSHPSPLKPFQQRKVSNQLASNVPRPALQTKKRRRYTDVHPDKNADRVSLPMPRNSSNINIYSGFPPSKRVKDQSLDQKYSMNNDNENQPGGSTVKNSTSKHVDSDEEDILECIESSDLCPQFRKRKKIFTQAKLDTFVPRRQASCSSFSEYSRTALQSKKCEMISKSHEFRNGDEQVQEASGSHTEKTDNFKNLLVNKNNEENNESLKCMKSVDDCDEEIKSRNNEGFDSLSVFGDQKNVECASSSKKQPSPTKKFFRSKNNENFEPVYANAAALESVSMDPYQFIASQRTPKKPKKRGRKRKATEPTSAVQNRLKTVLKAEVKSRKSMSEEPLKEIRDNWKKISENAGFPTDSMEDFQESHQLKSRDAKSASAKKTVQDDDVYLFMTPAVNTQAYCLEFGDEITEYPEVERTKQKQVSKRDSKLSRSSSGKKKKVKESMQNEEKISMMAEELLECESHELTVVKTHETPNPHKNTSGNVLEQRKLVKRNCGDEIVVSKNVSVCNFPVVDVSSAEDLSDIEKVTNRMGAQRAVEKVPTVDESSSDTEPLPYINKDNYMFSSSDNEVSFAASLKQPHVSRYFAKEPTDTESIKSCSTVEKPTEKAACSIPSYNMDSNSICKAVSDKIGESSKFNAENSLRVKSLLSLDITKKPGDPVSDDENLDDLEATQPLEGFVEVPPNVTDPQSQSLDHDVIVLSLKPEHSDQASKSQRLNIVNEESPDCNRKDDSEGLSDHVNKSQIPNEELSPNIELEITGTPENNLEDHRVEIHCSPLPNSTTLPLIEEVSAAATLKRVDPITRESFTLGNDISDEKQGTSAEQAHNENQENDAHSTDSLDLNVEELDQLFKQSGRKTFCLNVETQELLQLSKDRKPDTMDVLSDICTRYTTEPSSSGNTSILRDFTPNQSAQGITSAPDEVMMDCDKDEILVANRSIDREVPRLVQEIEYANNVSVSVVDRNNADQNAQLVLKISLGPTQNVTVSGSLSNIGCPNCETAFNISLSDIGISLSSTDSETTKVGEIRLNITQLCKTISTRTSNPTKSDTEDPISETKSSDQSKICEMAAPTAPKAEESTSHCQTNRPVMSKSSIPKPVGNEDKVDGSDGDWGSFPSNESPVNSLGVTRAPQHEDQNPKELNEADLSNLTDAFESEMDDRTPACAAGDFQKPQGSKNVKDKEEDLLNLTGAFDSEMEEKTPVGAPLLEDGPRLVAENVACIINDDVTKVASSRIDEYKSSAAENDINVNNNMRSVSSSKCLAEDESHRNEEIHDLSSMNKVGNKFGGNGDITNVFTSGTDKDEYNYIEEVAKSLTTRNGNLDEEEFDESDESEHEETDDDPEKRRPSGLVVLESDLSDESPGKRSDDNLWSSRENNRHASCNDIFNRDNYDDDIFASLSSTSTFDVNENREHVDTGDLVIPPTPEKPVIDTNSRHGNHFACSPIDYTPFGDEINAFLKDSEGFADIGENDIAINFQKIADKEKLKMAEPSPVISVPKSSSSDNRVKPVRLRKTRPFPSLTPDDKNTSTKDPTNELSTSKQKTFRRIRTFSNSSSEPDDLTPFHDVVIPVPKKGPIKEFVELVSETEDSQIRPSQAMKKVLKNIEADLHCMDGKETSVGNVDEASEDAVLVPSQMTDTEDCDRIDLTDIDFQSAFSSDMSSQAKHQLVAEIETLKMQLRQLKNKQKSGPGSGLSDIAELESQDAIPPTPEPPHHRNNKTSCLSLR